MRMAPRKARHHSPRSLPHSPDLRHEGSVITPDTGLVNPNRGANHDDINPGHQLRLWADRGSCLAVGWGNVVVAAPRSDAQLAGARIIARRLERIGRPSAEAAAAGGFAPLFSRFRAGGGAALRGDRCPLDAHVMREARLRPGSHFYCFTRCSTPKLLFCKQIFFAE